jgi:hypothetical protein
MAGKRAAGGAENGDDPVLAELVTEHAADHAARDRADALRVARLFHLAHRFDGRQLAELRLRFS